MLCQNLTIHKFQSMLPRRERQVLDGDMIAHTINFNPRSRGGSDEHYGVPVIYQCLFQSTLPRRERLCLKGVRADVKYFNPRSRGGSDRACQLAGGVGVFQSTLPRRERQLRDKGCTHYRDISIHAPAEGATKGTIFQYSALQISIHAPAEGATCVCVIFKCRRWNFNPRSRGGSDVRSSKKRSASSAFQSTLPRRERLQDPADMLL